MSEIFLSGLNPPYEQLLRRVCQIVSEDGERIATGILVNPDLVLTCYHVDEKTISDFGLSKLICRFDDFPVAMQNFEPTNIRVKTSPLIGDDAVVFSSPVSEYDRGNTNVTPTEDNLDYVILRLSNSPGKDILEDGTERGWVSLPDQNTPPASGNMMLLSYPNGRQFSRSNGKLLDIHIANRCHYTAQSSPGSSGGLVCLAGPSPQPIVMHIGYRLLEGNTKAAIGVPLQAIHQHATNNGGQAYPTDEAALTPMNLAFVCGTPEEGTTYQEIIKELLLSEIVSVAFSSRQFRPQVKYRDPSDLSSRSIVDVQKDFDLDALQGTAQADIAIIAISSKDGPGSIARLYAAFGFLCARIGVKRVHLFYQEELDISFSSISGSEFRHQYSKSILECAEIFDEIVKLTSNANEDTVQGIFEIARIALPEIPDETVFESAEFGAVETLDIVGLRFGRLESQLPKLFDSLSTKAGSKIHVRIAFPSAKVSAKNPYLLEALQAGGNQNVSFLNAARELATCGRYEKSLLERIKFLALDDIPTILITAADLVLPQGRMLIAPILPVRIANRDTLGRPRILVQNKLSEAGVYHAYKKILVALLEPAEESGSCWTLDEIDKLNNSYKEYSEIAQEPT